MQQVDIESSTFERLQEFAQPFIDTPDMVINRALDALEKQNSTESNGPPSIDPQSLPDVTHTKISKALLNGRPIVNPKWNLLVDELVIHVMKQLGDYDQLKKFSSLNIVRGYKDDRGFRHVSQINVSVRYTNACKACEALVEFTKFLGYELELNFMWREKEGAAYPGESASLKITNTGEVFFARKGTTIQPSDK